MARIVIGTGLWSTIRGHLNAMFTEIYAALGSTPGGGGDTGKYSQVATLAGGEVTRVTTTLATEPYSVMMLDSEGNNVIPMSLKISEVGGVYVLDIYSTETIEDINIKITY
jgi:hypothetical protein